jgi:2-iminoacetate synthase
MSGWLVPQRAKSGQNYADGLITGMGITVMSAGSHTDPGGYTGAGKVISSTATERGRIGALPSTNQANGPHSFPDHRSIRKIADHRSPANRDIARTIQRLGYEPVVGKGDWGDVVLSA